MAEFEPVAEPDVDDDPEETVPSKFQFIKCSHGDTGM